MLDNEKKSRNLHRHLSNDGYQLGSYDEFRSAMQDETKRKNLFNNLTADGYGDALGDYDTFNEVVTYKTNTNIPTSASTEEESSVSRLEDAPEVAQKREQEIMRQNGGWQMPTQTKATATQTPTEQSTPSASSVSAASVQSEQPDATDNWYNDSIDAKNAQQSAEPTNAETGSKPAIKLPTKDNPFPNVNNNPFGYNYADFQKQREFNAKRDTVADKIYNDKLKRIVEEGDKKLLDIARRTPPKVVMSPNGTYSFGETQAPKTKMDVEEAVNAIMDGITVDDLVSYFNANGIDYENMSAEQLQKEELDFRQRVIDRYLKDALPNNEMNYGGALLHSVGTKSIIGRIITSRAHQDPAIEMANEKRYAKYEAGANWGTRFSLEAAPILADIPAFKATGIGSGLVSRLTTKLASKVAPSIAFNSANVGALSFAQREAFHQSWMRRAGRIALTRVAPSFAANTYAMGNYNLANTLTGGLDNYISVDEATGEKSFDGVKLFNDTYGKGAAFSLVTIPGNLMTSLSRKRWSTIGSFVVGSGMSGGYMTMENAMEMAHQYNVSNGLVNPDGSYKDGAISVLDLDWGDWAAAAGRGFTTDLVFKFQHAVQSPKHFFTQFSSRPMNQFEILDLDEGTSKWKGDWNTIIEEKLGKKSHIAYYMREHKFLNPKHTPKEGVAAMEDEYKRLILDPEVPKDLKSNMAFLFTGHVVPVSHKIITQGGEVSYELPLSQGGEVCAVFNHRDGACKIQVEKHPWMNPLKPYAVKYYDFKGQLISEDRFANKDAAVNEMNKYQQIADSNQRILLESMIAHDAEVNGISSDALIGEALNKVGKTKEQIDKVFNKDFNKRTDEEKNLVASYLYELERVGIPTDKLAVQDAVDENDQVSVATDKKTGKEVYVKREDGKVMTIDPESGEKKQVTENDVEGEEKFTADEVIEETNKTPEQIEAEAQNDAQVQKDNEVQAAKDELKQEQVASAEEQKRRHDTAPFFLKNEDGTFTPLESAKKGASGWVARDFDGNESIVPFESLADGNDVRNAERVSETPKAENVEPAPKAETDEKPIVAEEPNAEVPEVEKPVEAVAPEVELTEEEKFWNEVLAMKNSSDAINAIKKKLDVSTGQAAKMLKEKKNPTASAPTPSDKAKLSAKEPGVVRDENSNGVRENVLDEMDKIAKRMGAVVKFVDKVDEEDTGNAAYEDGVIYIQKNNPEPIKALLGHEMTHHIKTKDKSAYKNFMLALRSAVGENQWRRAMNRMYALYGGMDGIKSSDAMEEVASDFAGSILNNTDRIDKFTDVADKSTIASVRNWLDDAYHWWTDDLVRDKTYGGDINGSSKFVLSEAEYNTIKRKLEKAYAALDAERMRIDEGLSEGVAEELANNGVSVNGGVPMNSQASDLKDATGYETPIEKAKKSRKTKDPWMASYLSGKPTERDREIAKVVDDFYNKTVQDDFINDIMNDSYYPSNINTDSGEGALRSNVEYIFTFDLDTTCPRTFQFLAYADNIEKKISRPLTQHEAIQLIEEMRAMGQQIPCVYCYAENKRQALKQYYIDFINSRNNVINAKTNEDAFASMYGHKNGDPTKPFLKENTQSVMDRWRNGDEMSKFNPDIKSLCKWYNQARSNALADMDLLLSAKKIDTSMNDENIAKVLTQRYGYDITSDYGKAMTSTLKRIANDWRYDVIDGKEHKNFDGGGSMSDLHKKSLVLWNEMDSYGKSASSAKNSVRYFPYTDELNRATADQKDYINGMGGLRMHSTNDFRIDYVGDYFQLIADMAKGKWMGHTYTKNPLFVKIFGQTGYRINMSCAAYDVDGKVVMNEDEGWNWIEAQDARKFSENAGAMFMTTSDLQLSFALNSDWVDMIIPFHHSGLPKEIWYNMRAWQDYTTTQSEKFFSSSDMKDRLIKAGVDIPKGAKSAEISALFDKTFNTKKIYDNTAEMKSELESKGVKIPNKSTYEQIKKLYKDTFGHDCKALGTQIKPHFLPYETHKAGNKIPGWRVSDNDQENAKSYLALCEEYGVRPRFKGVEVELPDGTKVDITEHPNYIKVIKETARMDTTQKPIEFNLDQPVKGLNIPESMTDKDGNLIENPYAGNDVTPIQYALYALRDHAAKGGYESYGEDRFGIVDNFIENVIKYAEKNGKERPIDYISPTARMMWNVQNRAANELSRMSEDEIQRASVPYHPAVEADGMTHAVPSNSGRKLSIKASEEEKESYKQGHGSAKTSINQIPRATNYLVKNGMLKSGYTNLDMGGGKYDTATNFLNDNGIENLVFDPFNRNAEHNKEISDRVQSKKVDTVTCNNVLNVIDTEGARLNVILQCAKALKPNGTAYFSVYEGSGTGDAKDTKNDRWQNNKKTAEYIDEIETYFGDVSLKNGIITAREPKETTDKSVWQYDGTDSSKGNAKFSIKASEYEELFDEEIKNVDVKSKDFNAEFYKLNSVYNNAKKHAMNKVRNSLGLNGAGIKSAGEETTAVVDRSEKIGNTTMGEFYDTRKEEVAPIIESYINALKKLRAKAKNPDVIESIEQQIADCAKDLDTINSSASEEHSATDAYYNPNVRKKGESYRDYAERLLKKYYADRGDENPDDDPTTPNGGGRKLSVKSKEMGSEQVDYAVNINDDSADFTDMIMDKKKKIETRDNPLLGKFINQRVAIMRTGKKGREVVGYATIAGIKEYNSYDEWKADQELHKVKDGSKFAWMDETTKKYGIILEDPKREKNPYTPEFEISHGAYTKAHEVDGSKKFSMKADKDHDVFYSNAERFVEDSKQEKASGEQWLKMIKNGGGLKAGEDKWIGLSSWLNEHKTDKLTKQDVLDYVADHKIKIEEVNYGEDGKPINDTRSDYVTKGLENNKEIALVVPDIESYNINDEVHFGDAGDGRAVAWVRFGDTTEVPSFGDYSGRSIMDRLEKKYGSTDATYKMTTDDKAARHFANYIVRKDKVSVDEMAEQIALEDGAEVASKFYTMVDAANSDSKVLVIDEIQSKRHDDGRKKGYQNRENIKEKHRMLSDAYDAVEAFENEMFEKYDVDDYDVLRKSLSKDEADKYRELQKTIKDIRESIGSVPDAPFDKNWDELVMKRMLRYAADNGYDKIAWTTGEQQQKRYGTDVPKFLYDEVLPQFLNKYGKKWGVKVGEIFLPNVERDAQTMHSIDVPDAMKESVKKGQPMFSIKSKEIDNDYKDAVKNSDKEKAKELFDKYVLNAAEQDIVPILYAETYYVNDSDKIAHALKNGDADAIRVAVDAMVPKVPKDAVLIPIPSHEGTAKDTKLLAEALSKATGAPMMDILQGLDRESAYWAKKNNHKLTSEMMGMHLTAEIPEGKTPIFVDNVIDRGTTGAAAVRAAGGGIVLAYAKTDKVNNDVPLKSAEPITYDRFGNLIPLSERFNRKNNDYKYSIKTDEQIHSDNFKNWFGDWEKDPKNASKVVDKNGKPLVVYHASPEYGYTVFDTNKRPLNVGSHFGTESAANDLWKGNRGIYKVYLDIKNPYECQDMFEQAEPWMAAELKDAILKLPEDSGIRVKATEFINKWFPNMMKSYVNKKNWSRYANSVDYLRGESLWNYDGDHEVVRNELGSLFKDALKELGYDGIKYSNDFEDNGSDSWVAFDSNQIKSAETEGDMANNGEFSRTNPDIRFSIKPGASKRESKSGRPLRPETVESEARKRVNEMHETLDRITTNINGRSIPDMDNSDLVENTISELRSFINDRLNKVVASKMGSLQIKSILSQLDHIASSKSRNIKDVNDAIVQIQEILFDAQMRADVGDMEKLMKTETEKKNANGVKEAKTMTLPYAKVFGAIKNTLGSMFSEKPDHVENVTNNQKALDEEVIQATQRIEDAENAELEPREEDLITVNEGRAIRQSLIETETIMAELEDARKEWENAEAVLVGIHNDPIYKQALKDRLSGDFGVNHSKQVVKSNILKRERVAADKLLAAQENYLMRKREIANQIYETNNALKAFIGEGREAMKRFRDEKAEYQKNLRSKGCRDYQTKPLKVEGEKGTRGLLAKKAQSVWDAINTSSYSLHYLLNNVRGHFSGEGELYEHFFLNPETSIVAAEGNMADGLYDYGKSIDDAIADIFGRKQSKGDKNKNFKWLRQDSDAEIKGVKRLLTADDAKEFNKRKQDGRDDWTEYQDSIEMNGMTKGNALYAWLSWQQPDGRMKMLNQGYTEESIEQIEKALGNEYIEFGQWMTEKFLPELRETRYNVRHEQMYGTTMANNPHYFPLKIDKSALKPQHGFEETLDQFLPTTIDPHLINRRPNGAKLDIIASNRSNGTNALDVIMDYGKSMEHWYNMAPVISDFNTLFSSKMFCNVMENERHGSLKTLMKAALVATGSLPDKEMVGVDFLNKTISTYAKSAIGYRLMTAAKQITSYPAFYAYAGDAQYYLDLNKNLVRVVNINSLGFKSNMKWAEQNLPLFRQRMRNGDLGLEGYNDRFFKDNSKNKIANKVEDAIDLYGEGGMWFNRKVDQLTIAAGARAVYECSKRKLKDMGYSDEEAEKRSILEAQIVYNQSQQSSVNAFSSYVQKNPASIYRSLTLFRNASIGYGRMFKTGINDAYKALKGVDGASGGKRFKKALGGAKSALIFGSILPTIWGLAGKTNLSYNIIQNAKNWDWDDEELNSMLLTSNLLGMTLDGTIIGSPVNAYVNGYEWAPYAFIDELGKTIEKFRQQGFENPAAYEYFLEKTILFGTGFNYNTWKNAFDGGVHAYLSATDDSVPVTAWLDAFLVINMNKEDRMKWSKILYNEYGPSNFAKAWSAAASREVEDRKARAAAKEYFDSNDSKLFKKLNEYNEWLKVFKETYNNAKDSGNYDEYNKMLKDPMHKYYMESIDLEYNRLIDEIRDNIKGDNDKNKEYFEKKIKELSDKVKKLDESK